MGKQIFATATVLVLAATAITSARASDHRAGQGGSHVRSVHVAAIHGGHRHRARLARVRGPENWRQDGADSGGFIDLGPLGFTAACGAYRSRHYCGQGYSVSGWTY